MLRLLLDEHIDPQVAVHLRASNPAVEVTSLHIWAEKRYLGVHDSAILTEAHRQGYTLVTYDVKSIVPLLKMWGEQEVAHGGVIFIKSSTIAQDNVGALLRALLALWGELGAEDWTNATIFLAP